MATTSPTTTPTTTSSALLEDLVIDLTSTSLLPTGHRLAELVQALTGCSVERAELAVCDPTPVGPSSSEDALHTMAEALVRLKARQPAGTANRHT